MFRKTFLVGLIVLTSATTHAEPAKNKHDARSAVREAIAAQERKFASCLEKHDAVCVVDSFYVSDTIGPIASEPGGPPIRGRSALIKAFEGVLAQVKAVEFETVDLITSGDLAVQFGRAYVTSLDGSTSTDRFTVVWLRDRGEWRAKLDFLAPADGWTTR